MKRKKMTFSLKMLWEGFRQCKMIGIFAAVIIVLGAVLAPVAQVIEMSGSPYHTKVVYEAWSANPVMLLVLVAADDADPVPLPGQPCRIGPVPCVAL